MARKYRYVIEGRVGKAWYLQGRTASGKLIRGWTFGTKQQAEHALTKMNWSKTAKIRIRRREVF